MNTKDAPAMQPGRDVLYIAQPDLKIDINRKTKKIENFSTQSFKLRCRQRSLSLVSAVKRFRLSSYMFSNSEAISCKIMLFYAGSERVLFDKNDSFVGPSQNWRQFKSSPVPAGSVSKSGSGRNKNKAFPNQLQIISLKNSH